MKDFAARVVAYAAAEGLWQRGERILVGCSGGPDSLVLAVLLARVREQEGIAVGLAYVHHHLRPAADAEVGAVAALAAAEGVPFYRLDADVPETVRATGKSVETAARELRYRRLYELAAREQYDRLAVAHHADDQAETVLHHVLRGTGLRGLRGMLPRRGRLIRPLLAVTRAEIEQVAAALPYRPCIDETNTDTTYLRNALRHRVLPLLAEYNPQIRENLCRLADLARYDTDYLETSAAACYTPAIRRTAERLAVARKELASWPVAVQRQCLRELWRQKGRSLSCEQLERLRHWVLSGQTGTRQKTAGVTAVLTATELRVGDVPASAWQPEAVYPDATGRMQLGEVTVRRVAAPSAADEAYPPRETAGPIGLRYRRPGDRIRLVGGTKKWKDWLIDAKIPREERDTIVLLADDRYIYRAFGYVTAANAAQYTEDCTVYRTL